jgi:hypothetical protein
MAKKPKFVADPMIHGDQETTLGTVVVHLTRKQILQMAEMANHFTGVDDFTIEVSHESGIGPSMRFKFTLDLAGEAKDVAVDATDVSTW